MADENDKAMTNAANRSGVAAIAAAAIAVAAACRAFGANAHMQDARKSPEWFTRGVMYQIQPRSFTPEGTLKAAEKKLSYLKDLGVTIAYIVQIGRAHV